MDYPDWQLYEDLYARYFKRPASELIDLAGDVKGKNVLDLCGGTGRLSEECVKRGANSVTLVDMSDEMTKRVTLDNMLHAKINVCTCEIRHFIRGRMSAFFKHAGRNPDFVFCRQAINYWFNTRSISLLAEQMAPGSVFVFNTFNLDPGSEEWPIVREYMMEDREGKGRLFTEVTVFDRFTNMLHHMQCRDSIPMHATSFPWIDRGEYVDVFSRFFEVHEVVDGKTLIYKCVKRG